LSLSVGEPDFPTPDRINEAARDAIRMGKTKYTSNNGLLELRQRISQKLEEENGIHTDPEEVLITTGSSEGLDLALRAILNPGDEIIIPEPCYVAYSPLSAFLGAKPVTVPTFEKDNFRVRADEINEKVTKKTKAILFATPVNPTGSVLGKRDIKGIADIAIDNDLYVISDELYESLVYDGGKNHSIAAVPGMDERTVTLNGFSKNYSCTGWRIGWAQGKGDLIGNMIKIHQYSMLSAPTLGQYAMLASFECEEVMKEMVSEYDKRRRVLVRGLNKIDGISCNMPAGAFYAFPNVTGTGLSSEEFCRGLLEEENLAVVPGEAFGESGKGFVRFCYTVPCDMIEEALERIERFLS